VRSACAWDPAFEQVSVVGFKGVQAGVEQFAPGHYDDVEPTGDLVTTENLSNQSFSSISYDGSPELPGGRDAQPSHPERICQDEDRAVATLDSDAPFVDLLELRAPADPFGGAEFQTYSLLTVSRFRPFARRRLSTSRPFFVLIRTRNPCVFFRWRVFG